jgi:acetyl-CoA synthetase
MEALLHSFSDYKKAYADSIANPEQFWAARANAFEWMKPWEKVLEWNFDEPKVQWFVGGKTNVTVNCLDRHLALHGDKTAIILGSE